jgi:hypothetical protein
MQARLEAQGAEVRRVWLKVREPPVSPRALESLPARSAQQQVPQRQALPQPELGSPLEWPQAQARLVSQRLDPEWMQEQLPESLPAGQLARVSAQALLPIPWPNVPPLLQRLPRPQHPSGARELSPRLPQSRNSNAFSFPLRQNPATGQ